MIGTIAKLWGAAALVAGASLFAETAAEQPPVPSSETEQENAGGKMAGNLLSGTRCVEETGRTEHSAPHSA